MTWLSTTRARLPRSGGGVCGHAAGLRRSDFSRRTDAFTNSPVLRGGRSEMVRQRIHARPVRRAGPLLQRVPPARVPTGTRGGGAVRHCQRAPGVQRVWAHRASGPGRVLPQLTIRCRGALVSSTRCAIGGVHPHAVDRVERGHHHRPVPPPAARIPRDRRHRAEAVVFDSVRCRGGGALRALRAVRIHPRADRSALVHHPAAPVHRRSRCSARRDHPRPSARGADITTNTRNPGGEFAQPGADHHRPHHPGGVVCGGGWYARAPLRFDAPERWSAG